MNAMNRRFVNSEGEMMHCFGTISGVGLTWLFADTPENIVEAN